MKHYSLPGPLGYGLCYISHNGKENGKQVSNVYLYKWNGDKEKPLQRVGEELPPQPKK